MDGSQAAQLFQDPRFKQGSIVFIDARDEQHYQEGHIPGAYEFDPYRPEKYFAAVLPVCKAAEQIVVYCNGGDCDDSESAALLLRDVGIANQKLFVYGGGITEWTTNGLPVETGERNSGNLRNARMNNRSAIRNRFRLNLFTVLARWLLGAAFLYLGLSKALHPVDFLKLMRQYDLTQNSLLLNFIAAALPWFEIFCGLLLLAGIAVRGTALTLMVMLVPFTLLVFHRALRFNRRWPSRSAR